VQVDTIKIRVETWKRLWCERLKLQHDTPLSKVAFSFYLRRYIVLEHCIMLDDDPELLESDGEEEEWLEGEGEGEGEGVTAAEDWVEGVGGSNPHESGEVAGGGRARGSGNGRGGGGSDVGFLNTFGRHGRLSQPSAEAEGNGATTSTMEVSKRRTLLSMLNDMDHYFPDGTPMDPEHFEVGWCRLTLSNPR
jgi:hypothetical protein